MTCRLCPLPSAFQPPILPLGQHRNNLPSEKTKRAGVRVSCRSSLKLPEISGVVSASTDIVISRRCVVLGGCSDADQTACSIRGSRGNAQPLVSSNYGIVVRFHFNI